MHDAENRWYEVGQRIEALGLKLRLHFEQTNRSEPAPDPLQRLKTSVTEAFEAAGNAVQDDAVKADLRETGRLFLDAMSASLAKASEHLRDRSRAPGSDQDTPPAESKSITPE